MDITKLAVNFDPDARVVFACDYGDISSTQQALFVQDAIEVDERDFEESGYSHSGIAFVEDDESAEVDVDEAGDPVLTDDDFDPRPVVVLRSIH
jgi:hypothetical protein